MTETYSKNPYASPAEENPAEMSVEERQRLWEIRHRHERTEGAVTSLSGFCLAAGVLAVISGVMILSLIFSGGDQFSLGYLGFGGIFLLAVAIYLFFMAYFLNKRTPDARVQAVWMAAFLLLLFPLGTVYGFYALMILNSEQAKTVFSHDYQEILRLTENTTPFRLTAKMIFGGFLLFLIVFLGVMGFRGCASSLIQNAVVPGNMNLQDEIKKANNPTSIP